MRTSHNTTIDGVDPDVAAKGDNHADISGMASGASSDELNDRLGRPREGQISPAGAKPHFVNIYAGLTNPDSDPNEARNARVEAGTVYRDGPRAPVNVGSSAQAEMMRTMRGSEPKIPDVAFEPILTDQDNVPYGWIVTLNGEWIPAEDVRRLRVDGGKVTMILPEEGQAVLCNFGPGAQANESAQIMRARIAWYISQCKGWVGE